jgi:hypothetical protein
LLPDGLSKTFSGEVANLVQVPKVLSASEIMDLVRSAPDTASLAPKRLAVDPVSLGVAAPGTYSVTTAAGRTVEVRADSLLLGSREIPGPWEVSFTPGWGAPEKVMFDKLISWDNHPDARVRYYSGSATYRSSFTYTRPAVSNELLKSVAYLDLGKVAVMAEVIVNGKNLGILWRPPFRVDITGVVVEGKNDLVIRVVNLWANRMIGDEHLPEDSERNPDGTLKRWPQWLQEGKPSPTGRYTFTTWRLWGKDSPLQTSGLLGPVTVSSAARFIW